jgi:hypothetical protein
VSPRRDPAGDVLTALRESVQGDEPGRTGATFMRGLTLGALVGAAIAGSAIWQRRSRRARQPAEPEDRPG